MNITVLKMSYLFANRYATLSVKSDGTTYDLLINGIPTLDGCKTAQEAVCAGMEYLENHEGDEE
jgi:hypothetical protein